jgi:TRAP-type mannitol/chloroaromatic compound transport system substrate-binding protein
MKNRKLFVVTTMVLALFAFSVGAAFAADEGTIKLRGQSSASLGTFDYVHADKVCKRIEEMTGGRVQIELLAPGTIVPAFEVLDAANRGVLDVAATWEGYWVGKNTAFTLFASAAGGPFGMDNLDYWGWLYFGGGMDLWHELIADTGYTNVVSFMTKGEFPEPLGWFPEKVEKYEDLKGYKMRVAGMAADVFKEAGVSVVTVPAGDILPLLDRETIDATEFSDPHSDMLLGIPDVLKYYHAPGVHQPTGIMSLHFNKKVWDKLPPDVQNIIELVCNEMTMKNTIEELLYGKNALEKMEKENNVEVVKTPDDVIISLLKAWDKVAAAESEKNEWFKKIYESQKEWASEMVPFRNKFYIDYSVIHDYYWKN